MTAMVSPKRLSDALRTVTERLLAERSGGGMWTGELSSSALSTATAVIALSQLRGEGGESGDADRIQGGLRWLAAHQNPDGGWGDTVLSDSNISTTALCWSAFGAARADAVYPSEVGHARAWLVSACRATEGTGWERKLAEAIRLRYGKDKTFSVPILMACALSGRLGPDGWNEVPGLPFELSVLPQKLFGAMRLPVVSYALPALIAIGQVVHHFAPHRNPLVRWIRDWTHTRATRVLERIQPDNGGFLEATPLTSFVLMSLAASGREKEIVALRAARFLRQSLREDGSWPIDSNLATWVSTLAISALGYQSGPLRHESRSVLRDWILGQQFREVHPYTLAAPGGWAWTDLPGGVPDADDTPGALLALGVLGAFSDRTRDAVACGVRWLVDLQNTDGGMPTFCKGWGTLPFDRSGADLTAHALRAWSFWVPHLGASLQGCVRTAMDRALRYLEGEQRADGSWVPLWFGNQNAAAEENPVYGTARVLLALKDLHARGYEVGAAMLRRAENALVAMQLADGGWGGGMASDDRGMVASVEETGWCLEALAGSRHGEAFQRGVEWLVSRVESGRWTEPAPIGFYFAKLWYYERLYPIIAAAAGLGAAARTLLVSSDLDATFLKETE